MDTRRVLVCVSAHSEGSGQSLPIRKLQLVRAFGMAWGSARGATGVHPERT